MMMKVALFYMFCVIYTHKPVFADREVNSKIKILTYDSANYKAIVLNSLHTNFLNVYEFGQRIIATVDESKLSDELTKNVIAIEDNVVFGIQQHHQSENCQEQSYSDPNLWYLNRINQREGLNFSDNSFYYYYSEHDNGGDIIAYVVDTGINIDHLEFKPNRAKFGFVTQDILDYDRSEYDLNGHGTHVAGLIAGTNYGVAKFASVVSVKSLDKDGVGSLDDILQGIEYIYNQTKDHSEQQMKVVVNLSFTVKGSSTALESAIQQLYGNNIIMVAASGNSNDGSCYYIPGKYNEVISVGATNEDDKFAIFSNWGSCVDILSPGTNLRSAGINNETDSAIKSGTSFAAPLVSGVIARYLSNNYDKRFTNPQDVYNVLLSESTANQIDMDDAITPNKMVYTYCTTLSDSSSGKLSAGVNLVVLAFVYYLYGYLYN